MYYVYSLKCKEWYYVGCTDDLKERMMRHQKGHVPAMVEIFRAFLKRLLFLPKTALFDRIK
jgi:predicted GIY-YIG superfamily endonuclease